MCPSSVSVYKNRLIEYKNLYIIISICLPLLSVYCADERYTTNSFCVCDEHKKEENLTREVDFLQL